VLTDNTVKNQTKSRILVDLRTKGVDTTRRRFLTQELIDLCVQHHVPTVTKELNIEQTPNGMLQILYEHGWMDANLVKYPRVARYSLKGKKIDLNVVTREISEE